MNRVLNPVFQRMGNPTVKKLTLAIAVLASLGGAGLATSASALPGAPMGVTAPETVETVGMNRGHRMHMHSMHRRHMMHHRHMMHGRMHHRRMMRRM